ncbi:hypothetical protein [Nocardioides sp. B-3]|uniref:hypothetical protein n=1 Tax=Nocardioides sp. B-3 TaxID=2895565 RepID=UPI0021521653|nr:hypothetical protein [Nocardioides sp. B-3]UUZ61346.1 hypothetical protein LP418_12650 [Nocardioides sp. B-3]
MFDGQRYCLGLGWTMKTRDEAAAGLAAAEQPTLPARTAPEQTGDLDPMTSMRQRGRALAEGSCPGGARGAHCRRPVGREGLADPPRDPGVPLPDDFLNQHPEAAVSARATTDRKHPRKFRILDERQVRPQQESYWCGPGTVQMIAWGWRDRRRGRALWADRLHTTTAGTGITDMVRVVNHNTGYDNADRAGPYVVLDISDFTYKQWWRLMKRHIHTYKAPVVLHPILLKQYFPYLDDDASGHFGSAAATTAPRTGRSCSATSSPGTRAGSTRPSRGSRARSGSPPTRASAPTGPTSSTTSGV